MTGTPTPDAQPSSTESQSGAKTSGGPISGHPGSSATNGGSTTGKTTSKVSAQEVQKRLVDFIEKFRAGKAAYSSTVALVTNTVLRLVNNDVNSTQFTSTLDHYLTLLDAERVRKGTSESSKKTTSTSIPAKPDNALNTNKSTSTASQDGGQHNDTAKQGGDGSLQGQGNGGKRDGDDSEEEVRVTVGGKKRKSRKKHRKRHSHNDPSDSSSSSSSDADSDIDDRYAPWKKAGDDIRPTLHPEVILTLDFLENWRPNLSGYEASFSSSAARPAKFPLEQLKAMLRGKAIDMDAVFSAIHSLVIKPKPKTDLGSGYFLANTHDIVAPKQIGTFAQWNTTWNLCCEAYTFLFPHRAREVTEYGRTINGYSTYVTDTYFGWIYAYDRAIRQHVATSNRNRFIDFHDPEFIKLYGQYVSPANSRVAFHESDLGVTGNDTSAKKSIEKTNEYCIRWNENRCPFTGNKCKHLHRCSNCGGAHKKKDDKCKNDE